MHRIRVESPTHFRGWNCAEFGKRTAVLMLPFDGSFPKSTICTSKPSFWHVSNSCETIQQIIKTSQSAEEDCRPKEGTGRNSTSEET